MVKTIPIESIELDVSIQCRHSIRTKVVEEYALEMVTGAKFPPIIVFANGGSYYLADGWHRVLASKKEKFTDIEADVRKGGRAAALKYALIANLSHGLRRDNKDKRRSVEIALKEFPKKSSRMIADLCGVSNVFVSKIRDEVLTVNTSDTVVGKDGVEQPAKKSSSKQEETPDDIQEQGEEVEESQEEEVTIKYEPSIGLDYADAAIYELSKIDKKDKQRQQAFTKVIKWIKENR